MDRSSVLLDMRWLLTLLFLFLSSLNLDRRHRCPHRPFGGKPHGPCTLSEYHDEYKRKDGGRPANFKPTYQPIKNSGPISDATTQRVDYIKHPTNKPHFRQPDQYTKPAGDIDAMTSYKKEYTPKDAPLTKPIKREDGKRIQGRFEGDPTYKADYRKWQLPEKKLYHDPNSYNPPEAPFEGSPTYKADYHKHPFSMRQSLRPDEGDRGPHDPFDGRTGYRDDYIKHPLERKAPKEREAYKGPGAPIDDLTTHKQDYGPKQGGKAASFKPEGTAFRSSDPLSDNTTNRNDFKKWPLNRPLAFRPDEWVKPAGDMDLRTTHQLEYDKKPMTRAQAVRPAERRPVTANFDDTTTNREDFRKWPLGDRMKPMMKPDYVPPEAPFEGISTVKAHYTPKPLNVPRSFKPEFGIPDTGPFDGNTMYRTDYIPKEAEPCPAGLLDTAKSKYTYTNVQDQAGHKFYQPMFESLHTLPTAAATAGPKMSNVSFA